MSKITPHYLDIPPGRHRIQVSSDGPVYAQFHSIEKSGYLLPNINGKPLAISKSLEDTNLKLKPSVVSKDLQTVQNNEWKASGLKVANVADDLWRQRRDDQNLRTARDNIFDAFSFFRDILPVDSKISKKLSMDWVVNYHLSDTNLEGRPYKFVDTQTDFLLKQLILGYFIETEPSINLKLNYTLPKLNADSALRIIIQQANLNEPQILHVQYDNTSPEQIKIYPAKDLPNSAYSLNTGLVGLSILEKNENYKQPRFGTMGGAFAQNHIPGELSDAGIITLPLPKNTESIKIWQENSKTPLKIALQYRDSKKLEATPLMRKGELDSTSRIVSASTMFIDSLRFYHKCINEKCSLSAGAFYNYLATQNSSINIDSHNKEDIKEIYNSWQDLDRFLYERYLKFSTGIDREVDESFIHPSVKKSIFTEDELKFAENLTAKKDWPEAAIAWSVIIEKGDLKFWHLAILKELKR